MAIEAALDTGLQVCLTLKSLLSAALQQSPQTMANLGKKVIFLNAIESKMHSNEDSEPSTIRETVDEEKARRKTPSIKLDDLFKKQIKMLHRGECSAVLLS